MKGSGYKMSEDPALEMKASEILSGFGAGYRLKQGSQCLGGHKDLN
jgi:hypothetical protein